MILSILTRKAKSFLKQYEQKDPVSFSAAQQAIGGLLIIDGFIGIDNPFQGKKRSGIFGTLVGIVVGIIFMLAPAFIGNMTGINAMTATTNAVVVAMTPQLSSTSNGGNACALTVRYTIAGKEYTQPSSISSSSNCALTAGQTVPINYNPQQPGAWVYGAGSMGGFLALFFWSGLLVAIASFVTFIIRLLSIIFGWKLLRRGRALAKTLPQGVSLGTLIEEIKQNFTGTLFNGGGVSMPSMPFMQHAQAQVQTPVAVVAPSPAEVPVQPQPPISPAVATVAPQIAVSRSDPTTQPQQGVAPAAPSVAPDSYASDIVEVEPATVPAVQPQSVVQSSDPSSTPRDTFQ